MLYLVALFLLMYFPQPFLISQTRIANDLRKEPLIDNPKNDGIIVADVGSRRITAREFVMSYEFGPAFPKKEGDSKRRYLNYMIYEKLLALDGYARHLDKSPDAQRLLDELEGDLSTEELYKDDILRNASLSPGRIEEGVRQERVLFEVKWLFAPTKEAIEKQELLLKGASFDSLFSLQLHDHVTAEERSMKTTRLRAGIANPSFARVLDTLKAGKVSAPVAGNDGYYLIFIAAAETQPLMSETEELKLRSDVERALTQHIADSLSDVYVNTILVRHRPSINRKSIDILQSYLAGVILTRAKFAEWDLPSRLERRWGTGDYAEISRHERDTLVLLDGGAYTMGDFLNWYHFRETNLKFSLQSQESMFASLERFVWLMVRDRLIADRARSRGMQTRTRVQNELRWWKDKIVYQLARQSIADSISTPDGEVAQYYAEHRRNYRDENGGEVSFEKAKEDVRKDCMQMKLAGRLLHRILALKNTYKVNIHETALSDVRVGVENDPKAIDLYSVKKGGTFPHPAFPTIDYEWQAWE
jgi:hypothetical protein